MQSTTQTNSVLTASEGASASVSTASTERWMLGSQGTSESDAVGTQETSTSGALTSTAETISLSTEESGGGASLKPTAQSRSELRSAETTVVNQTSVPTTEVVTQSQEVSDKGATSNANLLTVAQTFSITEQPSTLAVDTSVNQATSRQEAETSYADTTKATASAADNTMSSGSTIAEESADVVTTVTKLATSHASGVERSTTTGGISTVTVEEASSETSAGTRQNGGTTITEVTSIPIQETANTNENAQPTATHLLTSPIQDTNAVEGTARLDSTASGQILGLDKIHFGLIVGAAGLVLIVIIIVVVILCLRRKKKTHKIKKNTSSDAWISRPGATEVVLTELTFNPAIDVEKVEVDRDISALDGLADSPTVNIFATNNDAFEEDATTGDALPRRTATGVRKRSESSNTPEKRGKNLTPATVPVLSPIKTASFDDVSLKSEPRSPTSFTSASADDGRRQHSFLHQSHKMESENPSSCDSKSVSNTAPPAPPAPSMPVAPPAPPAPPVPSITSSSPPEAPPPPSIAESTPSVSSSSVPPPAPPPPPII